jgi:NifU-like protein involved in Fe-S cluster formation
VGTVNEPLYTRDILRLAASIPHLGRLPEPEAIVAKRAPVCGSQIIVDLVLDKTGRVAALGQEVKACAFGQASAALLGAHVLGRSPEELAGARDALAAWLAGTCDDPGAWPGLDILAPARRLSARHGAILLPFQAAAEAAALAARATVRP